MIWTALATVSGFLKRVPWQVWLVLAVLLSAWLWGNHRYSEGVEAERDRWEIAQQKAKERAQASSVNAADQRAVDQERNSGNDEARQDAARDGGRVAANCERLRQAGTDLSTVPACAGR